MKSGQAIGERVACGQEQHRREHAPRADRLAEVATVGVGQSDVDDERVGRAMGDDVSEGVGAGRYTPSAEAFGAEGAHEHVAQAGVVLDD